ncbi:hypothetical protein QBC37DRAFT_370151 [Rhypophila decipiens]|uniref:Uncharacterized protein n=1 Tax=Rhypophila decipiens TaxID=261697 RepID=A0AAN6YIB5_9PEZI|nr:hypothetical protein QBC37DRAFT_370151 [Rhypophila decipiens]
MPDLNSVPPSPRHLYQGPDQGHQSAILQMPPPPLPSASTSSANVPQSSGSRPVNSRRNVDLARQGSSSGPTSREAAPLPGEPPSLDRESRTGYFVSRGAAQGGRPNPVLVRDNRPAVGPGPSRHARPMTAAELYSELEQEQEAMVNFLSRELQSLRDAHNSSVLSNSSSASNSVSGTDPINQSTHSRRPGTDSINHSTHPRPSTRQRTQSNTSSSANPPVRPSNTMPGPGISAPAATRNQARPQAAPRSASSSTASLAGGQIMTPASGSSRVSSFYADPPPQDEVDYEAPPHMQGQYTGPYPLPSLAGTAPPPINSPVGPYSPSRSNSRRSTSSSTTYAYRQQQQYGSRSFSSSLATTAVTTPATSEPSPALLAATPRQEAILASRQSYESVLRENEALKNRIRELDRQLRQRRELESIGVRLEEVRVGESAAGGGVEGACI